MPDAAGQRVNGDSGFGVSLLSFRLLDVGGGQLDLDDMRAELGGDMRGVGDHINRRFSFFRH